MKAMTRVALFLGFVMAGATSVDAAEVPRPDDADSMEVFVVNNFLEDVRVFWEDAEGRLHSLGRVARGALKSFELPEQLGGAEFRIKVYPSAPVWSPISEDYGVRTRTLVPEPDTQVRLWLEADLRQSIVELARG